MDKGNLLRLARQWMGGELPHNAEPEGVRLASCMERLLEAKEPLAPRYVAWYARTVLIPAGEVKEAIRLLNERIKWDKKTPWDQQAYNEAMGVLVDICPGAFSD